jgi:hypothetical protein
MEFINQQTNISLGRQMVITLIRCALSMWTFGQRATVKRYSADGEVKKTNLDQKVTSSLDASSDTFGIFVVISFSICLFCKT